jgi:hypothetical protein
LEIVVKKHGKESVEAAKIFHTVGNLANAKKELEEAKKFHQMALDIKKQVLGPSHAEVSYTLGMLATDFFYE